MEIYIDGKTPKIHGYKTVSECSKQPKFKKNLDYNTIKTLNFVIGCFNIIKKIVDKIDLICFDALK